MKNNKTIEQLDAKIEKYKELIIKGERPELLIDYICVIERCNYEIGLIEGSITNKVKRVFTK